MIIKIIIYFVLGLFEQICSIAYYKTGQKNYDFVCACFDLIRGTIWLFVISSLIDNLQNNIPFGITYIIGCSVGDYIGLKLETRIEKFIIKIKNKGRKKRRWYLVNKYKR